MNNEQLAALIGTILAALGLPALYSMISKNTQIKADADKEKIGLEAEKACEKKIKELEIVIAKDRLRMSKIVTGVDMMLTMLENEFSDDDKYQNIIEKVRVYLKYDQSM